MKSRIALIVLFVLFALTGPAAPARTGTRGHAAVSNAAVVGREQPLRLAPSAMALAGIALLATGAATRRGATGRA